MANYFSIPLNPYPETFQIELGGVGYTINTRWNDYSGAWYVDVIRLADGVTVMRNQPIVAGINIAGQYRHIFADAILTYTDGVVDGLIDPTYTNFGKEAQVLYVN